EAHAFRIEDVLTRLNQLRSAGELQFLDRIPAAAPTVDLAAVVPPPEPEPEPEAEAVVEAAPEPEPEAEPEAEMEPEPEPEPAPEPEVEAVAEPAAAPEPELSPCDPVAEVEAVAAVKAELPAEEQPEEAELAPGRKVRHSIVNKDPQALNNALKDPVIAEIVDLFSGEVVDIHK
ncbi:MAG: hypothetical protein PHI35_03805, partial [Victivallaceae bacterium]|nr:hypothetical protein [Victivallaceae bacterium]